MTADSTLKAAAANGARPRQRRSLTLMLHRHLRSFQRESGFPYDQYVWVYSGLYRIVMRRLHRLGQHWFKRMPLGGGWCQWCGLHVSDPVDEEQIQEALRRKRAEQ